jgi:hypothetical protein
MAGEYCKKNSKDMRAIYIDAINSANVTPGMISIMVLLNMLNIKGSMMNINNMAGNKYPKILPNTELFDNKPFFLGLALFLNPYFSIKKRSFIFCLL